LCGTSTRALAVGTVVGAAGVAFACRDKVAAVASAAWEDVKGLASAALGWLLRPAFALASW
jgi:hypothetical protein